MKNREQLFVCLATICAGLITSQGRSLNYSEVKC